VTLEACLERLAAAIGAARQLGLPTDDAESVAREAAARLGFPSDAYVLALVGGTGVGKSSLLNALAGGEISPASARRPTTGEPVAWVPAAARPELGGLLGWLGVRQVATHEGAADGLGSVVVLDLPDMDSIARGHRQRVEEMLPRVDAVAWVTDPEKYHDAVLHDDFLRRWLPRLSRQVVVLNKTDRVSGGDGERLRADLRADVGDAVPVALASAVAAHGTGLGELRAWIGEGIEAKRVVRARLARSAAAAATDLAASAGLTRDPRSDEFVGSPLIEPAARRAALDRTTAEVLRTVDLPGLERQAVAATRARARARGTGPVGLVLGLLHRASGREARTADPSGFLMRWRERATLIRAVDALRRGIGEAIAAAPPSLRSTLAAEADATAVEHQLGEAIDAAVSRRAAVVPSSRLWPLLGALQTVASIAIIVAIAWLAILVLFRPPVDTVALPVLGPVPMPLAILGAALLAGWLLAWVLATHAGWVAKRWARALGADVRAALEATVTSTAFAGVDRLDAARSGLAAAATSALAECAQP
jgi:hypothetical protein